RPDVLADRPRSLVITIENVAKSRLPLTLRPGVHAVAESARSARRRRNGPDANLRVFLDHVGEDLEARAAEMLGHILHLDRVSEVRLVAAVLRNGNVIGNARERLADLAVAGKLLENAADDRLHGLENVFLLD